jgi:hypothetical protein
MSLGPSPAVINEEPETSSKHESSLLAAPQIPAQDLQSSPIDESKWFGFDNNAGDDNTARRMSASVALPSENPSSNSLDVTRSATKSTTMGSAMSPTGPEAAIGAQRPPVVPAVQIHPGSGEVPRIDASKSSTAMADNGAATSIVENTPAETSHSRNVSDVAETAAEQAQSEGGNKQLQPTLILGPQHQRRNSAISAVSSASPDLHDGSQQDLAHRSVSPAENATQVQSEEEAAPGYEDPPVAATTVSKDEEAALERAATQGQDDPVPSYEENPGRPARIGPNAQIVPVANLAQQQPRQAPAVPTRPFSFEGADALQNAQQAYVQTQAATATPSQPLSPVSQTASKDYSQVSAEEIAEDKPRQSRQSKSYSRPFGQDPVSDHPAFRPPDQPVDRTQMYSTSDQPPTNARRIEEDAARFRQQLRPAEDEGYRIPGPYHQEYRSPKPRQRQSPSPTAAHARQPLSQSPSREAVPFTNAQQSHAGSSYNPQAPSGLQQHSGVLSRTSTAEQPAKGRSFGAFLRGKSKPSPSADQAVTQDRQMYADPSRHPEFLPKDSQPDSFASGHSSQGEAKDVLGQLPQTDKSRRRLSKMSLSGSTAEQAAQGKKKKRFSAMGNLFSRSDKSEKTTPPQRSTTLPPNSQQPSNLYHPNVSQYYAPDGQQQTGPTAGTGNMSYYQNASPYKAPEGSFQGAPLTGVADGEYHHNESQRPKYDHQAQGNVTNSPSNYESRPQDLRIDTTGYSGRQAGMNTAPPNFLPRDPSHQVPSDIGTRSSTQPGTFEPPRTRAPISASGGQRSNIDARVVELHKRSRSPKLGRPGSPEDDYDRDIRHNGGLAPPGNEARNSGGTPVEGLGTFINKKISPVDGIPRSEEEQEKPYRIGLPGEEEESRRRTRQLLIEQGRFQDAAALGSPSSSSAQDNGTMPDRRTVAERMMAPAQGPGQDVANSARAPLSRDGREDRGQPGYVAELPGSKAEGYESEEEITMSATVRPGDWDWNMPAWVDDTK